MTDWNRILGRDQGEKFNSILLEEDGGREYDIEEVEEEVKSRKTVLQEIIAKRA
jgi:hypothetical protein